MSNLKLKPDALAAFGSKSDDLQHPIRDTELPETTFSRVVDRPLAHLGSTLSWLWLGLMAVIVVNVAMKNLFGDSRVEFEEIQWHLYSALFMLGLSAALVADDHVRVDLLYDRFSLRTKAWVDALGIVFLLLPFLAMLLWYGLPFVADSLATGERSSSPAGLPHRWLIKSTLVIGCALLALAALARLQRTVTLIFLTRASAPVPADRSEGLAGQMDASGEARALSPASAQEERREALRLIQAGGKS
jgi:TRAP-type mannitol/chloroaromatic compound transport system permease small subunit